MDGYKLTLQAARVNAGLTMQQAAKALGISTKTLSKYETDPKETRYPIVVAMVHLYAIPYEFLDFDKPEKCMERNREILIHRTKQRKVAAMLKDAGIPPEDAEAHLREAPEGVRKFVNKYLGKPLGQSGVMV